MLVSRGKVGIAAVGRNFACTSCTRWCGDNRGLRAQQWFGWAMNMSGYRLSGSALCCSWIPQHRCAHPSPIVVPCAPVVAEPCGWVGARSVARCNSFEIQTAWPVCTAVRTVLCNDAHHMHAVADSGCDENAHQMCELPNYDEDGIRMRRMPTGRETFLHTRRLVVSYPAYFLAAGFWITQLGLRRQISDVVANPSAD